MREKLKRDRGFDEMGSKDTEGFVVLLREGSMSHGTAKKVEVGEIVARERR